MPRKWPNRSSSGFIPFCRATAASTPPTGDDWLHEVKYDGFRIQLCREGDRVRLFTKNGHDWSHRWPHLTGAALRMRVHQLTIDSELVIASEDGMPDFERVISQHHDAGAQLIAFDLLMLDGADWRQRPLAERKAKLQRLLHADALLIGKAIVLSEHETGNGAELYRHACKLGLEGIVSKRADSPYVAGVCAHWRKLKNPNSTAAKREAESDWNERRGRRRPAP